MNAVEGCGFDFKLILDNDMVKVFYTGPYMYTLFYEPIVARIDNLKAIDLEQTSDKFITSLFKFITTVPANGRYLLNRDSFVISINGLHYSPEEFLFGDFNLVLKKLFQSLVNLYNPWFLKNNPQIGLLMKTERKDLISFYGFDSNEQISSGENCGINLILPEDILVPGNARSYSINYQVSTESNPEYGYLLIPRSSIAKNEDNTIRQSNSIGLIDPSYRGHLIVKVDNLSDIRKIKSKGESISQLVMNNLRTNWKIQRVPLLSSTLRGTGGFGSTGK